MNKLWEDVVEIVLDENPANLLLSKIKENILATYSLAKLQNSPDVLVITPLVNEFVAWFKKLLLEQQNVEIMFCEVDKYQNSDISKVAKIINTNLCNAFFGFTEIKNNYNSGDAVKATNKTEFFNINADENSPATFDGQKSESSSVDSSNLFTNRVTNYLMSFVYAIYEKCTSRLFIIDEFNLQ